MSFFQRLFRGGLHVCWVFLGIHSSIYAQIGPGLGNLSYSPEELNQSISTIVSPNSHGNVAMVQGYLFVPFSEDGGVNGGFDFFDVSDPRKPKRVYQKFDESTADIREPHGFGLSNAWGGITLAYQTQTGFKLFDLTDPSDVKLISSVPLPGVNHANYGGVWWLHFQAPYVFAGAWEGGVFVVDCSDLQNPVLINHITRNDLGGTTTGPVFVVGNLLVAANATGPNVATMDVTDPRNPIFLDKDSLLTSYSWHVNGNKIFGTGTTLPHLVVADLSDPKNLQTLGQVPNVGRRGGYVMTQDQFAFAGFSSKLSKIDISDPENFQALATYSTRLSGRDEDFSLPLGNLIWGGDDHGVGSGLFVHQTDPDKQGPEVNMVIPKDGDSNQGLSSRIGITLTDQILIESIHENTFIVQELNGKQVAGKYATQFGVVSFSPDQALAPNTTYEVIIPENGMKDYAGNSTPNRFYSTFSTGSGSETRNVCTGLQTTNILVGDPATIVANLSDNDSDLRYEWDMGDNSPIQVTQNPEISYTYSTSGSYLVRLSLVQNGKTLSTCTGTQTVNLPSNQGPHPRTSDIQYDRFSDKVWVVNPDNNSLTRINALELEKEVEITVGEFPRTLAQAPDHSIWVVNQNKPSISIISEGSDRVNQTIELPYASQPYGIVFHEEAGVAYVSLQATGEVIEIDAVSRQILRRRDVGRWPRAMALDRENSKLYVTRFVSNDSQGEVYQLDTDTFSPLSTLGLAIDPGPDKSTNSRGLPNYLAGIAISPSGNEAWVTSKKDNIQRGLARDRRPLTWENTLRSITSVVNLTTSEEDLSRRIDIDNSDSPTAINFSSLGDKVFIAIQGNNRVEVRNAYTQELISSIDQSGSAPQGLVLSPDNTRLFVHNYLSRTISVYNVEAIINGESNLETLLASLSTVGNERLKPEVLAGKKLFYFSGDNRMSKDGYISCASCHAEGKEDGRNWDFTQFDGGIRNSISLIGRGGMSQGFVHWAGDFDEIQDFEGQIRALGLGQGFMSDDDFFSGTRSQSLGDPKAGISKDLDALAAYLNSLDTFEDSPFRNADGSLSPEGEAGKQVFAQLNCGACHSSSDFSDSFTGLRHDIGTLQATSGPNLLGLDVPTLKDVWNTAPYLHDGSAETLEEIFTTRNPDNKHGDIESISETDLANLISYLLQIDGNEGNIAQPAFSLNQSSPANGSTFALNASINLEIQSLIPDISAVQYYANGALVATADRSPWNASWASPDTGTYTLEAKAIHGGKEVGTISARVFITIGLATQLLPLTEIPPLPQIHLIPNPTDRLRGIQVEVSSPPSQLLSLELYSLDGKLVYRKERVFGDTRIYLPLSSLAPGVYLVQAYGEGWGLVERLVVE